MHYRGHFGLRIVAFNIGTATLRDDLSPVVVDSMRTRLILAAVFVSMCLFGSLATGQSEQTSTDTGRKIVRKVDPQYPAIAKRMNLGGTVRVIAMVSSDGTVKKVDAVGGSPLLVQAAQNAVSLWKFAPGTESKETVELHFVP
jgi:TonB family protein